MSIKAHHRKKTSFKSFSFTTYKGWSVSSKNELVKGEVEGVDTVDDVNFMEIGGYVAKESVKDVAIGDNVSLMQSRGIT